MPPAEETQPPPAWAQVREAAERYRVAEQPTQSVVPLSDDAIRQYVVHFYDVRVAAARLTHSPAQQSRYESLEQIIMRTTGGDSWQQDPYVAIAFRDGVMAVCQKPAVQEQIRRLLTLVN